MREPSLKFLKALVNTPSPVGHEVRGQRAWLDYARQFADETFSDAYGNCVAVLNPAKRGGSPRLMLAGHADEIAMAVNYINDEGYLYVRKMGGVDAAITKAQRVVIHTANGPVKGVVGNVAPHLMKEEKDSKPPKIHDLFIDIGVAGRKEAEKLVRIGDPITLTVPPAASTGPNEYRTRNPPSGWSATLPSASWTARSRSQTRPGSRCTPAPGCPSLVPRKAGCTSDGRRAA